MSTLVYYTAWSMYGRKHPPGFVPEDLNNIAYSFWKWDNEAKKIVGDDEWADSKILPALLKTKKSRPNLKVQLSIFGWSLSYNASDAFLPQNIDAFIGSLRQIDATYPGLFDGWSIDWEYPTNDGTNYGAKGTERMYLGQMQKLPPNTARKGDADNFLNGLRKIKAAFPNKILSIASVAVPERMKYNVKAVSETIDELHLMTYDFHSGSWGETTTAHQTNPYPSTKWTFGQSGKSLSCEGSAKHVIGLGVDPKKVFIGGVCYSRGFKGTTGLGKTAQSGVVPIKGLTINKDYWEGGIADYKTLPLKDHSEMVDPETKGAYCYSTKDKTIHTYDNPESIKHKAQIVKDLGLGGIIFWELTGDDLVDESRSVIMTSINELKGGSTLPVSAPVSAPVVPSVPVADQILLYEGEIIIKGKTYVGKIYSERGSPIIYADIQNFSMEPVSAPVSTPVSAPVSVPVSTPMVPSVPVSAPVSAPVSVPVSTPSAEVWTEGKSYSTGTMVEYMGGVYECVQSHTSLTGWNPKMVPALWRSV